MASITGRTSTMLSRSSSCILGRTRVGRSSHVQMACKTTWSKSNSRKPLPSSQEVRSFSVYAGSSNGRKPLTKIVATIGPASEHLPVLPETVAAGMCIMRINFSHATPEEVELRLKNLAASPGEFDGQPNLCAVLLDTKGPEIRMGGLEVCKGVETPSENRKKKILLEAGAKVTLSTDPKHDGCGDASTIYVSYDKIAATVQPGSKVLLDDGLIELTVESVAAADGSVLCVVDNTNEIGERKGVNLPNASVDLPAMSEKDKLDIEYGIKHDMDFVAASFVRTAEQVLDIRKHIDECMKKHWPDGHVAPRIISKIESQEAVDNFDDILEVSDGIMVARGDLGVEVQGFETAAHTQCRRDCRVFAAATLPVPRPPQPQHSPTYSV